MPQAQIGVDDADGASFGKSATSLISFYGVSPVAQRASAVQATVTGTVVAGTGGFGFTTSATCINLLAAVQEIQYTLKGLGLWKGGL